MVHEHVTMSFAPLDDGKFQVMWLGHTSSESRCADGNVSMELVACSEVLSAAEMDIWANEMRNLADKINAMTGWKRGA